MPLNHSKIYKWSSSQFNNDLEFWPWTIENSNQSNFDNLSNDLLNLDQNDYEHKISKIHKYWFEDNNYESDNIIKQNLNDAINLAKK